MRGSGERRSVRRAAGSLALARGVGAGDAAAGARGHWRPPGPPPHPPRQAVGGGGARGSDSRLFDLGRLPVVIVCGPAWGPLGTLSVPGGAAVISAPSAPPPPRPHWPGAGRCHLRAEGRDSRPHSPPQTREPLSVPTCFCPAAPKLSLTPLLSDRRVSTAAGLLSTYPRGGD